jgi:hypothetical protein
MITQICSIFAMTFSYCMRAYSGSIKKVHNTEIHALSRIRTHEPSVRTSKDSSCLRPRGHCDRLIKLMLYLLLEFLFDEVSLFSPRTVCNLSAY